MCFRYSLKKHIPISPKYWNEPEWKPFYKRQIGLAHGLLKLYDAEIILEALNSKNCSWTYSLATKCIVEEINMLSKSKVKAEKLETILENKDLSFEEKAVLEVGQIRVKKKNKLEELE